MRFEQVLEPVTGRAVPVFKGEVLRITLVEGPQCVDFNCFNLHDYKERMSAGHMRRFGFRVRSGSIIWSNPPRFRPMMVIANLPDTCVTDLLGPRCDPLLSLPFIPSCLPTTARLSGTDIILSQWIL